MGIEQIAMIIEEPFSVLPLKQIADGIGKSATEHVEFNIIEEFGTTSPPKTANQALRKYMQEDYNIPEYLEALSSDITIHYNNLAMPRVSTGHSPSHSPLEAISPPVPEPYDTAQPQHDNTAQAMSELTYQQHLSAQNVDSPSSGITESPQPYSQRQAGTQPQSFPWQPETEPPATTFSAKEASPSDSWDYLAQATAAMEENLKNYDIIANEQMEVLRDIEKDVKSFDGREHPWWH